MSVRNSFSVPPSVAQYSGNESSCNLQHLFWYSGPWILRPLRSKTTCLIRPLLNAPMGFTFILTCVERPPVIPSQRPPCLVKSNTKLPVLKDHFHIWTVAKRFSQKKRIIQLILILHHNPTPVKILLIWLVMNCLMVCHSMTS